MSSEVRPATALATLVVSVGVMAGAMRLLIRGLGGSDPIWLVVVVLVALLFMLGRLTQHAQWLANRRENQDVPAPEGTTDLLVVFVWFILLLLLATALYVSVVSRIPPAGVGILWLANVILFDRTLGWVER